MRPIHEFQVDDLGVKHPDYFQGYGIALERWTHCTYGVGNTPREALDDCLESVGQMDFDADKLERDILKEWPDFDDDAKNAAAQVDDDSDALYHVGVKWIDGAPFSRAEALKNREVFRYVGTKYVNRVFEPELLANVSTMSLGDCQRAEYPTDIAAFLASDDQLLVEVPYTSGSDYSGSTVELANYSAFREEYTQDYVKTYYGGHGTYGIVLDLRALLLDDTDGAESILETIAELERYPVLDEDALWKLEMEKSTEAWDSWARDDFRRELEKRFGVELDSSREGFTELFLALAEQANEYWFCEGMGNDMYIRLEPIAAKATLEQLQPFIEE